MERMGWESRIHCSAAELGEDVNHFRQVQPASHSMWLSKRSLTQLKLGEEPPEPAVEGLEE